MEVKFKEIARRSGCDVASVRKFFMSPEERSRMHQRVVRAIESTRQQIMEEESNREVNALNDEYFRQLHGEVPPRALSLVHDSTRRTA